ncbi:hypothetical protein Tco_0694911 [Tanacetum coccineum]
MLDALALTPFYRAFLITADVPAIYMQEFWATASVHRAFATVINKCLSGKETGIDKIRLSRAQILWGMFHKKNIDYVYLLWEDLLFQIEYKDAKKTNNISYPRFTKIIIDYFMSKDPFISRRNKMFWHTAQDDTLFTSMRCISKHEDTKVYGTILLTELTNQAMLESKAYQTYYAFASGEKAPKPKYIRKKADSNTSPKKKHVQATKGTRLKLKAKVAKSDKKKQPAKKTKAKGLDVLSEVSLTEAEQIKIATKRSKKYFHVSHASGSGNGVNTQSKVPDEQQPKTSGTDEGTGTIPGVPDVPPYESESDKESWGDSEDKDDNDDDSDNDDDGETDDHDDDSDDERTKSDRDEILDLKLTNVDQTEHEEEEYDDKLYEEDDEEKLDDKETMDDEHDDEVIKEMYDDVNQEEEDAHVTLTPVIEAQKADEPVQSSFVSSDFTSKLLNLENPSPADNEITSLLETSDHHATIIPEITFGFTTTTPPPTPFFNPLLHQQAPTFTTTTSTNPTVTLPEIPNFASVFKFDQRVSALESELSELKQTNQFAEVVSLIPGIFDKYLASKMKEAVDAVYSTMKTIIKDQAKAQVSKIMPKIEKYVTESLGAEVLVRSTNQPQTAYAVAASLSEFELKKILIDKMDTNKSIN